MAFNTAMARAETEAKRCAGSRAAQNVAMEVMRKGGTKDSLVKPRTPLTLAGAAQAVLRRSPRVGHVTRVHYLSEWSCSAKRRPQNSPGIRS